MRRLPDDATLDRLIAERRGLFEVLVGDGFFLGRVQPFDFFFLAKADAYVVIRYPLGFAVIDVDAFVKESKASVPRSLSWRRAQEIALRPPTRDLGVEDETATQPGHLRREHGEQLARIEVRVLGEQHRASDIVIHPGIAATHLRGRQDLGRHTHGVGLRGEDRLVVERLLRPTEGQQTDVLEVEAGGKLGSVAQEDLAAAQVEVAEDRRAALDVGRGRGAPEFPAPGEECGVEARSVGHVAEATLAAHAGIG